MGTLLVRGLFAVALLLTFVFPAWAQDSKGIGVVTALTGRADLKRPQAPEAPLKARDNLFVRDVVDTHEQSLARILLQGKSSVTVRELSRFEIREEVLPDGSQRALINLAAGRIRVMVAKRLMKPGDEVQIRTPNAIASVRGSDGIVEVSILPDGRPQTVITGVSGEFELFLPTTPPFIARGKEFLDGPLHAALALAGGLPLLAMAETASDVTRGIRVASFHGLTLGAFQQATAVGTAGTVAAWIIGQLTQEHMNVITGLFQVRPGTGTPGFGQPAGEATERILSQGIEGAKLAALANGAQPGLNPQSAGNGFSPLQSTPILPGGGTGPCGGGSCTTGNGTNGTNLIKNGGFNEGLSNWTTTGAVIATAAAGGGNMAFLSTGCLGSACAVVDVSKGLLGQSTLEQKFTVASTLQVKFTFNFLTSEWPTFTGNLNTANPNNPFNDTLKVEIVPSTGGSIPVLTETVNANAKAGNFTAAPGSGFNGQTGFKQVDTTVAVPAGTSTFKVSVANVGDTAVPSGVQLKDVSVTKVSGSVVAGSSTSNGAVLPPSSPASAPK